MATGGTGFLNLPPELRNMVYILALPKHITEPKTFPHYVRVDNKSRPKQVYALLLVSKQVRADVAPMIYGNMQLDVRKRISPSAFSRLPAKLEACSGFFEFLNDFNIRFNIVESEEDARRQGRNASPFCFNAALIGRRLSCVVDDKQPDGATRDRRLKKSEQVYDALARVVQKWDEDVVVAGMDAKCF